MNRFSDIGPYTIVPKWLLDLQVSGDALRLYCRLGCYANQEGECWPRQTRLAADLNANDRSIRRWLKELEALGALLITPGKRGINLYRLVHMNPMEDEGLPMDGADADSGVRSPADDTDSGVRSDRTRESGTKKEPDPCNQKSFPDGKLRLRPSASTDSREPFAAVALQVWKQREQDNTLPFGRGISMLMQLSKYVVGRIGEEKAYSLLMGLDDFTPGYANFALSRAVKSRSTYDKNMETIDRVMGGTDERF